MKQSTFESITKVSQKFIHSVKTINEARITRISHCFLRIKCVLKFNPQIQ